jgi:diguanylate cyclase (GGDEF)-like protein/PAS domain S-box-containing protein
MTGYSAEEAIGRNCRFLQGPDRSQPSLQRLRADLAELRPSRSLLRNYRKDGTLFWNELSLYPIEDDNGETSYLVGVQRDVTAVVTGEEALKASVANEKLALAFANVGTCEWEVRSGQIAGSEIFFKLLGLDGDKRTLHYSALRALIHEDDRPLFDDAVKLCLAGHAGLDVEYRVRWPDGSMHWLHTRGDAPPDHAGIPQRLLCLSQDITQRREVDERVRYIAHHDALTGLPNRALLRDRLQQALNGARRAKTRVAILFVDLDHFKSVNDSLGHQIGDQLLQAVADRLRGSTRDTDTLCRQSGDEYLVVLPNVRDVGEVSHVAEKLVEALSKPYQIEGHDIAITTSIGISIYPDDGDSLDLLIRHADSAMYHAKGNGRNSYEYFAPQMNARAMEKLALARDLTSAIAQAALELHYQPQYDVRTRRLAGVEALVRWRRGADGLVLPDAFVPIAEESELILRLGEWVLNEACHQHRRWLDAGLPEVPIAVNFSPIQFRHKSIIATVTRALAASGLPPHLLEIELTERAIMAQPDDAAETLRALRQIGIHVAIDDFGTGYSNLTNLMRFPIDKLKIDRSFIVDAPTDGGAAAIVRAVINLGASLKLGVVAEGVETADQLAFLSTEACPMFQGFLASAAVPAEDFARLARAGSAALH